PAGDPAVEGAHLADVAGPVVAELPGLAGGIPDRLGALEQIEGELPGARVRLLELDRRAHPGPPRLPAAPELVDPLDHPAVGVVREADHAPVGMAHGHRTSDRVELPR